MTNNKNASIEKVKTLMVGNENNWSKGLADALDLVTDDYVFLLLEDIFIEKDVNEDRLDQLVEFCYKYGANYLNAKGTPYPGGASVGNKIAELIKGSHYRASLCNAFWKTTALKNLLLDGETPWQFEINGTKRSEMLDKFYGTKDELVCYKHVIVGGKLAADLADSEIGIEDIRSRFEMMSYLERLKFKITRIRSGLFCRLVPPKFQTQIRNRLMR